jgi:hypothetical protein
VRGVVAGNEGPPRWRCAGIPASAGGGPLEGRVGSATGGSGGVDEVAAGEVVGGEPGHRGWGPVAARLAEGGGEGAASKSFRREGEIAERAKARLKSL